MQIDKIVEGIIKLLAELGHPEWAAEIGKRLMGAARAESLVIVESAIELEASERKEIERVVGKSEFRINKDLLGGIKVIKGDQQIDLSVKKRMEDIYAD